MFTARYELRLYMKQISVAFKWLKYCSYETILGHDLVETLKWLA
jgi:hypothetical protein